MGYIFTCIHAHNTTAHTPVNTNSLDYDYVETDHGVSHDFPSGSQAREAMESEYVQYCDISELNVLEVIDTHKNEAYGMNILTPRKTTID